MLNPYRNGQTLGNTTYVECIDKARDKELTGEVNLWTGYQNVG